VRRGSTCAMPAEFQGGVANGNFMRCEERAIAPRACYLGTAINDVYKHQPNQLDVICRDRAPVPGQSVLYKPHGSLSHANQPVGKGGLVITQFDYLEMISDYREMLRRSMTDFGGTCVLVIGYSFGEGLSSPPR
jgi:hypothetical protein